MVHMFHWLPNKDADKLHASFSMPFPAQRIKAVCGLYAMRPPLATAAADKLYAKGLEKCKRCLISVQLINHPPKPKPQPRRRRRKRRRKPSSKKGKS